VSRHLLEQMKHFLTAGDPQADKFGASSIANLLASQHSDELTQLETTNDFLESIETATIGTQSEASSLQRGRTNFGGKMSSLIIGTSSGSANTTFGGTPNGVRIRHLVISTDDATSASNFRLSLGGNIFMTFWIHAGVHAGCPIHMPLGEFFVSDDTNPAFNIARTAGTDELSVTVLWEELVDDDSGYPTA
jgi:hypothetical protein